MSYEPRFQAQNPEISHYALGWSSCTAFSMAMAIDFATSGRTVPTGGQVRGLTHDSVGGLTLLQVDAVALDDYGVNFATIYRLPWPEYVARRNAAGGALLAGGYGPIADSRFDAGGGFRQNHCIFDQVAKTKDTLADGRRAGIYRYRAEPYPDGLLRLFGGHLDLGSGNLLGNGLVYASFPPRPGRTWLATIRPIRPARSRTFIRYFVTGGVIQLHHEVRSTRGLQVACSAPRMHATPGGRQISLVQVLSPGAMYGWWLNSLFAKEV